VVGKEMYVKSTRMADLYMYIKECSLHKLTNNVHNDRASRNH